MLEEKLEGLDKSDALEDEYFLISRRRDERRPDSQRQELLKRIDDKLAQYRKESSNNKGTQLLTIRRCIASSAQPGGSHQKADRAQPK